MTEQPPDWVIKTPSTAAIHQAPAQDTGTTNPLTGICSMLLGGSPFLGSLVNLGTGTGGGVPGALVGGSQTLADALCGFATGTESSGATADSLLSGATDVNDSVSANNFAMGILDMGQGSGGGSGNLALDGISGGLSFLTSLFDLLGACSCSSTYDPNTATPTDVLAGATDVKDTVTGNPMAMGILGLGQEGGASGNAILDAFTGVCSFWGQLCGVATGNGDVSSATPDTVLATTQSYVDLGHNWLTGGSDTGHTGGDLWDAAGALPFFSIGDAGTWVSDLMGLWGHPDGLGTGSTSGGQIADHIGSSTIDNIVGRLFGWSGSGFGHTDESDALQQQSDTLTSHSAQISQIMALLSVAPVASDDFERGSSSTLGADWEENYGSGDGTWDADGHAARWNAVWMGASRESLCRWVGDNTDSTTDYQTNEVILQSAPVVFLLSYGYNDVIGRCDSTKQNYIRFRVGANKSWALTRVLAGAATTLASGTLSSVPGAGSKLTLICGDKVTSTPRNFTVKIGASTIAGPADFGDTTSQYGAGYRGRGFGGHADYAGLLSVQAAPGSVDSFYGKDTD